VSTLIAIKNLTVSIGDKNLLENIDLDINRGDYLCLLGPNGAGKSTLLKCLTGIISPSQGHILLNNKPLNKYRQKAIATQIAYVPQSTGRELPFTAGEFIKMGRYAHHTAVSTWSTEDQLAIDKAIEITHTEAFIDRQLGTLSGGECQRVMIAASLAQQSPILLLDEPTSFLDPHHQVEIHQLIQQLNLMHNITIIEVSHDFNHAAQHSKRILALKQGKILWQGPANELISAKQLYALYEQKFVFVRHPQTGLPVALPNELSF